MGADIGRGIGNMIVFIASVASFCMPVVASVIVAAPLAFFGYATAAAIALGVGFLLGFAFLIFVLREV
jgi:hypothetical protein